MDGLSEAFTCTHLSCKLHANTQSPHFNHSLSTLYVKPSRNNPRQNSAILTPLEKSSRT